jgi:hypothetical protein
MFYLVFHVEQCERQGNGTGKQQVYGLRNFAMTCVQIRTPDLYRLKVLFNGN